MKIVFATRVFICKLRRQPVPLRTVVVDETPEPAKRNALYIYSSSGHQWGAALVCPCGCENLIELNLLPDASPCWKATQHLDSSISLFPSVWRKVGCRSHFWIKQGLVKWCIDS
jgi:hypothetical protein